jgi:hypothetical protein
MQAPSIQQQVRHCLACRLCGWGWITPHGDQYIHQYIHIPKHRLICLAQGRFRRTCMLPPSPHEHTALHWQVQAQRSPDRRVLSPQLLTTASHLPACKCQARIAVGNLSYVNQLRLQVDLDRSGTGRVGCHDCASKYIFRNIASNPYRCSTTFEFQHDQCRQGCNRQAQR